MVERLTEDEAMMERMERMLIDFKEEIKAEFRLQLGIQAEAFQHKLDLVVEGHQMLSAKIDRVEARLETRIDCLQYKLDAVAAQGSATAAKLDEVAALAERTATRLDEVAALAERTATRLDEVAALAERTATKLDGVAAQGETMLAKLDALAADLKAHRADTEAHPSVYRVKE